MLNDGDDAVDVEGGRVLKRVVSWVGGGGRSGDDDGEEEEEEKEGELKERRVERG